MAECWWWELKQAVGGVKPGEPFELKVKRQAIPIIFVPGIMGSRLKNRKSGEVVWDADKWGGVWMLVQYGMFWQGTRRKKSILVGETFSEEHLAVSDDDAKHNQALPGEGAKRGWGGVGWGSYGDILRMLNNPATWAGAKVPVALFFTFPVYAFGYNWTGDNRESGKALAQRIKDILQQHGDQKAKQVILVTHSMGGLVARAACNLSGAAQDVLGIVHGVQPVDGAGAAYWRMKGGFERTGLMSAPAAWVLGTDGRDVTSLLAEIPGGLELLPNKLYGTSWLKAFDFKSKSGVELPKSDPYQEIYLDRDESHYWRLVNPEYLVGPSRKASIGALSQDDSLAPSSAWNSYDTNLRLARTFHENLSGHVQHPETHFFLGTSVKTAGSIAFAHQPYENSDADVPAVPGLEFNRDEFTTYVRDGRTLAEVSMSRPADDGDGTVPSPSARALKQQGESHDFELPGENGKPLADFAGMMHEPAYRDKHAQDFTVDAIQRLCMLKLKKGGP